MATERLITREDLERHLPAELPFRGRTLKRGLVWDCEALAGIIGFERREGYEVLYDCDSFFNCSSRLERLRQHVALGPQTVHMMRRISEGLTGWMFFAARTTIDGLPAAVAAQMRAMYWRLEDLVEEEESEGCSVRPPQTGR